jgi:SAM-dependent methyltransferase
LLSLIVISLILLAVPILRKKEKDVERPYRAPLGTIGPIVLVLFFLVLLWNWVRLEGGVAISTMELAGSFLLLGLPFYFFVAMLYDPHAILRVNEKLAFLSVIFEPLFFPLTIRNKVLKDMGDLQGKKILEYGCSVGGLTKRLAVRVRAHGGVFASDLSLGKVKIAARRTSKHTHVRVDHHPHLDDFKLHLPKKVDGIVSIGMLSYMQHPGKILKSLGKQVKKGGEIIFVDYDKFFYIIPNVKWVENDKRKGLLWQYIVVVGKKR